MKGKKLVKLITAVSITGLLAHTALASNTKMPDISNESVQETTEEESETFEKETETSIKAEQEPEKVPETEESTRGAEESEGLESGNLEEEPETEPLSEETEIQTEISNTEKEESSETELPESEDLETEIQETELPETEVPETEMEAPESELPEMEAPETETETSQTEIEKPKETEEPKETEKPKKIETEKKVIKDDLVEKDPIFLPLFTNQITIKNLSISRTQIEELVRMMDGETGRERVQVVLHAYSLVGKVPYFWGGKSTAIGWDPNWGNAAIVTSEGSGTSGTVQQYGLDCSGFVTWAFLNAAGDASVVDYIGHGTSSQWGNTEAVDESEALPGDLAFMNGPEANSDNHVGIVVGHNKDGQLMYVHCNATDNNVSVTTADRGGFRYLRRPKLYTDSNLGFTEMVARQIKEQDKMDSSLQESFYDLQLMMEQK